MAPVQDAIGPLAGLERDGCTGGLSEDAVRTVVLLSLVTGKDTEPAEGWDGTDGRWWFARKLTLTR